VSNSRPATDRVAKQPRQAKLADLKRIDNATLRDNLKHMVNPPRVRKSRE
jgi:hypothetical protein